MTSLPAARARRLNNLPEPPGDARSLPERLLTSWWTWLAAGMTVVFAACLTSLYFSLTADQPAVEGTVPGVNAAAIRQAAWYALSTLLFWVVVYLAADRFRPQRWVVWFLSLGWGASVATFLAYHINTWAAMNMSVQGDFDPATSTRAAIFIAPFVEEAAKASVLFGLALLARYELVSKVSLVVMGGLSAAGFAFTENIIYYARAIVYSSQNIQVGDAEQAIVTLVWMRGFWTAWGHPLFTMMTAVGVAVALRTRSKVVRVLAPLVGYGLAALLHMVFNSQASSGGPQQLWLFFGIAVPLVLGAVIWVVRQVLAQGRVLRLRLADYVMMGWLRPADPEVFGRLRSRWRALLVAITRGWRQFLATWRLQRTLTELAYLRDAEVRGIVDATASVRARELLERSRDLRPLAIDDPRGLKLSLPRLRRRKPVEYGPPNYPGPAGLGGQWPSPQGAPLGSPGYSAVDPKWGPPPGS